MRKAYDCIIIGNGPAALLSALYLTRFKRSVLLIGRGEPRARWIPRIRNLVGHPAAPSGPALLQRLEAQIKDLGVPFLPCEASVRKTRKGFTVRAGKRELQANKIILATGMQDVQPELDNWPKLRRLGLLGYCPICDGYDHSKEPVGLLVQNAQGLNKVKFLTKFTPRLVIVKMKDFAVPAHHRRLIAKLRLKVLAGPVRLKPSRKMNGLDILAKDAAPVRVRLAYVALGVRVPDEAFKELRGLRRTREGFIQTNSHQQTSVKGVYAAGDCVHALSQVSVAAGHAAIAATSVHNELSFS